MVRVTHLREKQEFTCVMKLALLQSFQLQSVSSGHVRKFKVDPMRDCAVPSSSPAQYAHLFSCILGLNM